MDMPGVGDRHRHAVKSGLEVLNSHLRTAATGRETLDTALSADADRVLTDTK